MASEQAFWKNFCEGVGRMDLFEKWPGKTIADHARGNLELQAELRDIFRTDDVGRSGSTFADEHNTTIAPVNTAADGASTTRSSRTGSRGSAPTTLGADSCCSRCTSTGEELPVPTKAPRPGSTPTRCSRDVLGYDAERIAAIKASGAVG